MLEIYDVWAVGRFNKQPSLMLKLNIFCIKGKMLVDQTTEEGSFLFLHFCVN